MNRKTKIIICLALVAAIVLGVAITVGVLKAPKKIRIYDTLHRHKWIWILVMAVAHISNWFYPLNPTIKKEKI